MRIPGIAVVAVVAVGCVLALWGCSSKDSGDTAGKLQIKPFVQPGVYWIKAENESSTAFIENSEKHESFGFQLTAGVPDATGQQITFEFDRDPATGKALPRGQGENTFDFRISVDGQIADLQFHGAAATQPIPPEAEPRLHRTLRGYLPHLVYRPAGFVGVGETWTVDLPGGKTTCKFKEFSPTKAVIEAQTRNQKADSLHEATTGLEFDPATNLVTRYVTNGKNVGDSAVQTSTWTVTYTLGRIADQPSAATPTTASTTP